MRSKLAKKKPQPVPQLHGCRWKCDCGYRTDDYQDYHDHECEHD